MLPIWTKTFLSELYSKCEIIYFDHQLFNLFDFCARNACELSCTVADDDTGLQCLTILELVIGYTIFPSETLHQCIVTLCRTVNHARYCQASFKVSQVFPKYLNIFSTH